MDQAGKRYQRERNFKVFLTNPAMYTGLFGAVPETDAGFGHLVETAVFAQRFHEDARLTYARWGTQDCEVDLVETSMSLAPVGALEIKWTDRYVENPQRLKGLLQFAQRNTLADVWATTRSRFGKTVIDGTELRLWPAAALAYHYGARAVDARMSSFEARITGISES